MMHGWFGAELVFSFVGCLLIVYVSKWIGRYFLQKPEDFYKP